MISLLVLKFSSLAVAFGEKCDPSKGQNSFFGFPHWWRYISSGSGDALGNCTPSLVFPKGILAIGLGVLDMLLYLAGIVAVVSIIIAGISFITATGNAEQIAAARRRIYNALIGLAIVFVAAAFVSFIGNSL